MGRHNITLTSWIKYVLDHVAIARLLALDIRQHRYLPIAKDFERMTATAISNRDNHRHGQANLSKSPVL